MIWLIMIQIWFVVTITMVNAYGYNTIQDMIMNIVMAMTITMINDNECNINGNHEDPFLCLLHCYHICVPASYSTTARDRVLPRSCFRFPHSSRPNVRRRDWFSLFRRGKDHNKRRIYRMHRNGYVILSKEKKWWSRMSVVDLCCNICILIQS